MAAGDKSIYPAAWAAHEYKTVGTNAGDWCLPAAGIMTSIKNNMSAINARFVLTGGDQLGTSSYLWSSSEYDGYVAWTSDFSHDQGLYYDDRNLKNYSDEVRPVLEF